ncbi:MAG: DUF4132 domain-containing protein [Sandaracinaceae bacterium]|nr:DUF4132 domain-containing protein [Sandaracinaceae bacterium]
MSGRVIPPVDALRERERAHRPREPRVFVLELASAIEELPREDTRAPMGEPTLSGHLPRLAQLRGVAKASGAETREAARAWAAERHAHAPLSVRAAIAYVLADRERADELLREARGRVVPPPAATLALEDARDAGLVADAGAWLAKSHGAEVLERGAHVLAALATEPAEAERVVLAWLTAYESRAKVATSYERTSANEQLRRMLELVLRVGTPGVAAHVAPSIAKAGARSDVASFFKRFPELAEAALRPLAKGRGKTRDAAVAMLTGLGLGASPVTSASDSEPGKAASAAESTASAPPSSAPSGEPQDAKGSGIEVLEEPPWRHWSRSGLLVVDEPPMPTFDLPPEATAKHDREAWVAKLPSVARNVIFSSRAALPVAHAWLTSRAEREAAASWLTTFAPIAIYGLLPSLIGPTGPSRTTATRAVRFVWRGLPAERGPRIVERWCEDARADKAALVAAVRAIVEASGRWDCPSSAPSWPTWLAASALPEVRTKAGLVLPERARKHLVELMIVTGASAGGGDLVHQHPGVEEVREALDPTSLGALSFHVYTQWSVLGQNARVSWPLGQIALFGGRSAAHKLAAQIRSMATDKQIERAVEAVSVLARVNDESALVHLATLAESARNDKVRAEAKRLLDATAKDRGVSLEELDDLAVPDLGLDERGELALDFGPRQVRVRFDARLEPVLLDESDAVLARLPRPSKSDDAGKAAAAIELYKALEADAAGTAKAQLRRFERAMITGRTWSPARFEERLLGHPLLRTLVSGLVWSARVGELAQSFRVAEDRSLAGPDDEPLTIAREALVSIPHPLALDATLRARWGQLFGDYEILQPFPQLARETFELTDAERAASTLDRLAGTQGEIGNVYALEQRGWRVTGARNWVVSLQRELAKATVELRFTSAIDLGRPKETPTISVSSLGLVLHQADVTFALLSPVEASEVLRDLAFLA